MAEVTKDDLRHVESSLGRQIDAGFAGLNKRLDDLNGRTRDNEMDIAVLKDRGGASRSSSVAWGSGAGAFVVGVIEAVRMYLGVGK